MKTQEDTCDTNIMSTSIVKEYSCIYARKKKKSPHAIRNTFVYIEGLLQRFYNNLLKQQNNYHVKGKSRYIYG